MSIGQIGMLDLDEGTLNSAIVQVLEAGEAFDISSAAVRYLRLSPVGGEVIHGVALFAARQELFFSYLLNTVVALLAAGLTIFTLFSVCVGTVFGYFTAQRLTRRLVHIQQVSAQWGEGRFAVRIHDSISDEIGALSQHLNIIAAQLDGYLELQQQVAAMDERNRIARDLHDSVKQGMFAAIMQIASANSMIETDPTRAQYHVQEASRLAQHTQMELTALIHELRPVALNHPQSFVSAVDDTLRRWSQRTGIQLAVDLNAALNPSDDTATQLFRITQEALANIERHSGATAVSISGQVREGILHWQIADNGCGFDPAIVQGVGTQSMHERAHSIGGTLDIQTQIGNGTTIKVNVRQH